MPRDRTGRSLGPTISGLVFALTLLPATAGATPQASGGPREDAATAEGAPPPIDSRPPSPFEDRMQRRGFGFDLQLQGGYGLGVDESVPQFGLGRVRVGVLHVGDFWVSSVGASATIGGLTRGWAIGGQADALHTLSGLVLEAGLSYAKGGGPGFERGAALLDLSAGWSVFALEYQWRSDERARARHAVFVKLRVPVGLLLFFL